MKEDPVSQQRKQKKEYTFEEDSMITAQAAVNIVLPTKAAVDPVPFIAALLESYARRYRDISATPTPPSPLVPGTPRKRA